MYLKLVWKFFCYLDEILRSRRVFGRRDFKISPRSRWESRRDLEENLGEFLAAEVSRSCRDLTEISAISPAKSSPRFSPRSQRDLAKILVKILQGHSENRATSQIWKVLLPVWGGKMSAFWACACKLSWTLLSPARVQPLYGMGRKESSGTGLLNTVIGFFQVTWGKVHAILRQECWLQSSRGKFVC